MANNKHKGCWAAHLGNCSGGMSKEHVVSKAFYEVDVIKIWGLDWTEDKVIEIPISGAVSKILCRHHNSELSELDQSIKDAKDSFKQYLTYASDYLDNKQIPDKPILYSINARLLERWLLKTTLNVLCLSRKKMDNFWPDWYLTELAFAKRPFNYKNGMGLYFMNPTLHGNIIGNPHTLLVRPLILNKDSYRCLLGSMVTVFGMSFFLIP